MGNTALRKRLAPAAPLTLELADADGGKFVVSFRLCFDFNAAAEIKEKTGLSILNFAAFWSQIDDPRVLSVTFWAAALAHSPEYRTRDEQGKPTDEGLEVIRSYMTDDNAEPIADVLWAAYLLSLSKEKRQAVEAARERAKKRQEAGDRPQTPAPVPATTTPISSTCGPSPDTTSASTSENSVQ